jgi:enamine deaminase RidA (YjgF/YER057c/UK114 family)
MILEILNERRNISSGGADESIFGYSRAVRVGADVHVSGTCAPAGHEQSDAYTQTRAALTIIEAALAEAEAGAGLESFDTVRPASTLVQGARIAAEPSL